jgi:hypothetical protein
MSAGAGVAPVVVDAGVPIKCHSKAFIHQFHSSINML